jgi:hypothetical protein
VLAGAVLPAQGAINAHCAPTSMRRSQPAPSRSSSPPMQWRSCWPATWFSPARRDPGSVAGVLAITLL